jgi:hypothetical protein
MRNSRPRGAFLGNCGDRPRIAVNRLGVGIHARRLTYDRPYDAEYGSAGLAGAMADSNRILDQGLPEDAGTGPTSLPIVLNIEVFRSFLSTIRHELSRRGAAPAHLPGRHQLVIRAKSIADVPAAEVAVEQLLRQRGLGEGCDGQSSRSFCLRLPEKNNFRMALEEQKKLGTGGHFSSLCCLRSSLSARLVYKFKPSLAGGGTTECCKHSGLRPDRSSLTTAYRSFLS